VNKGRTLNSRNSKIVIGAVVLAVGLIVIVSRQMSGQTSAPQTATNTSTSAVSVDNARPPEVDSPETTARFAHAFALQSQHKLDEAIGEYRSLLADHPNHIQIRFNLAHALMSTNNCQAAIPEFERVLQLDPARNLAHLYIAQCSRTLGNVQVAQVHQARWDASQHH